MGKVRKTGKTIPRKPYARTESRTSTVRTVRKNIFGRFMFG